MIHVPTRNPLARYRSPADVVLHSAPAAGGPTSETAESGGEVSPSGRRNG